MGRKPRPGGVLQTARIPPKFSTLSRSMSIPPHLVTFPTSSPSTAPNYPVNFHRPQLLGTGLVVVGHKRYLELSHFLQPPSRLSALAIFFLWLSGAISHLAALALPCLSPVCSLLSCSSCSSFSCLQTQIVLTPPVTFKASPSTTLCPGRQKTKAGRFERTPKQGLS